MARDREDGEDFQCHLGEVLRSVDFRLEAFSDPQEEAASPTSVLVSFLTSQQPVTNIPDGQQSCLSTIVVSLSGKHLLVLGKQTDDA